MSAVEILDECLAEDSAPAFGGGQRLRGLAQVFEELGNSAKRPDRLVTAAVAGGDGQAGLAGMAGLAGDAMPQRRPAGQGLAVMVGIGQPPEPRPPVVDERDQAGDDLAALQVVGGKAGPAPVVLQLVEGIFAVAAIRADFEVEGADLYLDQI